MKRSVKIVITSVAIAAVIIIQSVSIFGKDVVECTNPHPDGRKYCGTHPPYSSFCVKSTSSPGCHY